MKFICISFAGWALAHQSFIFVETTDFCDTSGHFFKCFLKQLFHTHAIEVV